MDKVTHEELGRKYLCIKGKYMTHREYVEVLIQAQMDSDDLMAVLDLEACLGASESDRGIHLYWKKESWNSEAMESVKNALADLGQPAGIRIEVSDIPDRDWNASWAASLQPILLGSGILIRQSWNAAKVPENGFELIIDPKRAFGTGYHATTQLVVEWLEKRRERGERVLDVGTGSGILAMVALRTGAASALGIDNDPEAIECAREYAAVNGFGAELDLQIKSLEDLEESPFDLVLANLDRKTLTPYFAKFPALIKEGGWLVVSGLLQEDHEEIAEIIKAAGWDIVAKRVREEWMALQLRRA
jgi:ribosomal protein L11 methyltransferase